MMKKFIVLVDVFFISVFIFSQDTNDLKNHKDTTFFNSYIGCPQIISSNMHDASYAFQNLQKGLQEFNTKIEQKNNEIIVWMDSIKSLQLKLDIDSLSEDLSLKIDSFRNLIRINNDIIKTLNKGIEDISKSLDELQQSAFLIKDMSTRLKRKRKFKGHWASISLGFNTYIYDNKQIVENSFLASDLSKSFEFRFNPIQYSIPLKNRYIGLVTGLGFSFNNYELFENIRLEVDDNHLLYSVYDSVFYYKKNRFKITNFTVPLIMEFQLRTDRKDHRAYLGMGVVSQLAFNPRIKYVYYDKTYIRKEKVKNLNWPVNEYNYALTASLGYRHWFLYATYSFMPLFKKSYAPMIYPVSIGIAFNL